MAVNTLSQCLHIVSRSTAEHAGLKFYFTGLPCANGHYALRRTKRRCCTTCEAEYRAENRLEIAQYKREYHVKNSKKLCERSRKWLSENREYASERSRKHYLANKHRYAGWREKWKQRNPGRSAEISKIWREENRESSLQKSREWKKANKVKVLAMNRNRRSLNRKAEGAHGHSDVLAIHARQKGRCANCNVKVKDNYHVDHVVPLARGGSNWPSNLQILCPACNMSKGAKDPIVWRQMNGMLL